MDTSDLTQHASSSADWLVFSLSFFEPNNQSGIFHLESEKLLALNSNTKLLSWIELNLKKKKRFFEVTSLSLYIQSIYMVKSQLYLWI